MTDLRELVERLEAAEGPSRELDYLIHVALGWEDCDQGGWVRGSERMGMEFPAYTASIDAALTLVPSAYKGEAELFWFTDESGNAYASIDPPPVGVADGVGRTPALALTIAALRAREADDAD